MPQYISTTELQGKLSEVGNRVMEGQTYIVLKYSRPAFKLVPFGENVMPTKAKYTLKDLPKFLIHEKGKKKTNLAQNYKKYLYGGKK